MCVKVWLPDERRSVSIFFLFRSLIVSDVSVDFRQRKKKSVLFLPAALLKDFFKVINDRESVDENTCRGWTTRIHARTLETHSALYSF